MSHEGRTPRRRDFVWFALGLSLPVPWVAAHGLGGLGLPSESVAPLAVAAILGAAFLLSWSVEVAERYIPQSLALLVLALVGVLPEYAVDLHFAWTAGKDPSYAAYAVANMTGGNRLLIGLGWAAVVLVACSRAKTPQLTIDKGQRVEIRFLIWATLYSFVIPLSGTISLLDAAILFSLFGAYVVAAMRGDTHTGHELVGPALLIDTHFDDRERRLWALGLFLFAAWAIFVSAEPFAESLVHLGKNYAIDEFVLVQWVAPLASESPEFVVAVLFAWKLRGSVGIGALVSSKVNQWTLLVGAIPIAFALSSGAFAGLPLDSRQASELWLTSAQSLLAVVMISDLRFGKREALALAALFLVQLAFPSPELRRAFIWGYLALTVLVLAFGPARQRKAFFHLLFSLPSSDNEAARG